MRPLNVEAETYYDETEDDNTGTSNDEKAALLSANKTGDSYELTTNTEPGVQSVNDLNHIKVMTPADIMIVESILAKEKAAQNADRLLGMLFSPKVSLILKTYCHVLHPHLPFFTRNS